MDIKKKIEEFLKADEVTLVAEDCHDFILASRALSLTECYDICMLDITELSEAENQFLTKLHKYGRSTGVKDAAQQLFLHMSTKNGGQSAIEYLKQMSGEFSVEVTSTKHAGFAFNVNIGEKP